jgi:hypothetical protein
MLYERAILWSAATPLRPITPTGTIRSDNLIDFTIEDATKPVQPTATVYVCLFDRREGLIPY